MTIADDGFCGHSCMCTLLFLNLFDFAKFKSETVGQITIKRLGFFLIFLRIGRVLDFMRPDVIEYLHLHWHRPGFTEFGQALEILEKCLI